VNLGKLAGLALATAIAAGLLVTWLLYPAPMVPGSAETPILRGVPASQAIAELAALGLRGRLDSEFPDPLVNEGAVSWQSPAPFTVLPESAVVRLGVSSGPPVVMVPALVDLDVGTALRVLQAAGLELGTVDSVWSNQPRDVIVATSPDAGTGRAAGQPVAVSLSKGTRGGNR
jgi:beta-lactam-binding protein with PASTA domain